MGPDKGKSHAGQTRSRTPPSRPARHSRGPRAQVLARLDADRELLASTLEKTGRPLLRIAARRVPDALNRALRDQGGRILQETTVRLREGTAEEWVRAASRHLQARPALSVAGLVGVGLLAGRLLRVASEEAGGAGPLLLVGYGAGRDAKRAMRRMLGPRGTALLLALEAQQAAKGATRRAGSAARSAARDVGPAVHEATRNVGPNVKGGARNVGAGVQATKRDARRTGEDARQAAKTAAQSLREAARDAAHDVRTGLHGAKHSMGRPPTPHRKGPQGHARAPGAPAPGGYLGLGAYPVRLPAQLAQAHGLQGGLIVTSVEPGGPADRAGLQLGDTLLTLEGAPLPDMGALLAQLPPERVGQSVHAALLRAGSPQEVTLTVGARP